MGPLIKDENIKINLWIYAKYIFKQWTKQETLDKKDYERQMFTSKETQKQWVTEGIDIIFSKRKKKKKGKKKKKLLLDGGRFFILLNCLDPFKLTSIIPNRFFLVNMSSLPVILKVRVGFIGKKLVGSFEVDGLGWSLGLGANGNMGKVQVRERGLDLTEAIIKAIGKGATKLL